MAIGTAGYLPFQMAKGFVGISHTVGFELLLDGVAHVLVSVDDFSSEFLCEGVILAITAISGGGYDPTNSHCLFALGPNWSWNLVGGSTDTTGPDFHLRLDVFDGFFKISQLIGLNLVLDVGHGIVDDGSRDILATILHTASDKLGDQG